MNIWLINHYAVPPSLYPLARTTNFAKYLIRAGHTVTIFAASTVHNSDKNLIGDKSPYRAETVEGIPYVYVRATPYQGNGKKRILNMFQFAHRVKRVCKRFLKPDAILSSSATPFAAMAGVKLAKKYRRPGVVEITDLWPESFVAYHLIRPGNPALKLMYRYEKRLYQKADAVIFTMEGGKDYIIEKGWDKRISLEKIYHINNGVDLEVFLKNQQDNPVSDPDLDDPETKKVVYAGSLRLVNDAGVLLDAAKETAVRDAAVRFIIYGTGDQLEALQVRCMEENIGNVIFKGYVNKKYIPAILAKADINIIHVMQTDIMRYGSSLNKEFEYLASGKPILSDLVCGYDLLTKYDVGLTVERQEASLIVDGILRLLDMPEDEKQAMAERAQAVAADYDFKALTEKLLKVIENYSR